MNFYSNIRALFCRTIGKLLMSNIQNQFKATVPYISEAGKGSL